MRRMQSDSTRLQRFDGNQWRTLSATNAAAAVATGQWPPESPAGAARAAAAGARRSFNAAAAAAATAAAATAAGVAAGAGAAAAAAVAAVAATAATAAVVAVVPTVPCCRGTISCTGGDGKRHSAQCAKLAPPGAAATKAATKAAAAATKAATKAAKVKAEGGEAGGGKAGGEAAKAKAESKAVAAAAAAAAEAAEAARAREAAQQAAALEAAAAAARVHGLQEAADQESHRAAGCGRGVVWTSQEKQQLAALVGAEGPGAWQRKADALGAWAGTPIRARQLLSPPANWCPIFALPDHAQARAGRRTPSHCGGGRAAGPAHTHGPLTAFRRGVVPLPFTHCLSSLRPGLCSRCCCAERRRWPRRGTGRSTSRPRLTARS